MIKKTKTREIKKTKTKKEKPNEDTKVTDEKCKPDKTDKILEREMHKLKGTKVYVESEEDPDDYAEYPLIVVCTTSPKPYVYPIMMKLESSNIVRISAMNNYISTVLRVIELFKFCMDVRLKRKRQINHIETGKPLIVNEYVLEKIPACRNV